MNEQFTKISEFCLIGFSDLNPYPEIKQNLAIFFCLQMSLLLSMNLIFIFYFIAFKFLD